MSLTYRILPGDEWAKLDGFIPPEFLPSPEAATVAVAEDDHGEIQGALFMQLVLHMEPLLLRSPMVNFRRLHATLHEAVADRHGLVYFAFTKDDKVARMAEMVGMEPTDFKIWRKEV